MSPHVSLVHQFKQQQGETWDLAFSLDGRRLVSSDGYALYLWQLNEYESWEYVKSFSYSHASFPCFAPNNEIMAFRDEIQNLQLISSETGKEIATLSCPVNTDFVFSPDQRWLVTGDTHRNILLWDLSTYQYDLIPVRFSRFRDDPWEHETALASETIRNFQLTPDGQRLVFLASSAEGHLHICQIDPVKKGLERQKTFPHGSLDLAISPDGKMLAGVVPNQQVYAYKEEIHLYDLKSLRLLHIFPQTTNERYCLLAFSPDSQYLMSCKNDGSVDTFSLNSFAQVDQFAAHPGLFSDANDPIGGLTWAKTGYIAPGGANVFEKDMKIKDYTIKIWKVEET